MTTTYGTTTGSAAGVGARVALTLLGAAGLIVGAFMEWTADGALRHPSFQGIRGDKVAREVSRERPG